MWQCLAKCATEPGGYEDAHAHGYEDEYLYDHGRAELLLRRPQLANALALQKLPELAIGAAQVVFDPRLEKLR